MLVRKFLNLINRLLNSFSFGLLNFMIFHLYYLMLQIRTSLQVLALQREGRSVSFTLLAYFLLLPLHLNLWILHIFLQQVAVKHQKTAFPPNFVHSLDGSHMMMTAIACKNAGLHFAGLISALEIFLNHAV